MIKHINNNFEQEVLNSNRVILTDFYATWCGPCQLLSPILEEIANENNSFDIAKIDVDQNPEIAKNYKIMAVPTMLIFKNGEVVDKLEGVLSKETIISKINNYL